MVDFGSTLKQLRLQTGLTQKQLADKLGVSKSVVSYYELQERAPSPDMLVKLASVFRVTTDYLLGREPGKLLDVSGLNDDEIQLLHHTIDVLSQRHDR